MGYHTSNAAYAYDMRPEPMDSSAAPAYGRETIAPAAPETPSRPRLGVLTGAGREANQAVSPVFTHVIKVFLVVVALFVSVGAARVVIAGATTAMLNENAQTSASMESAAEESSNLEVMRSVYGSATRIRDIAEGTLGMVPAEGGVTIDLSDGSSSGEASNGADASATSAKTSQDGGSTAASASSAGSDSTSASAE